MKSNKTVLALCLLAILALVVVAWNPSSQSFNAIQFTTPNYSVNIRTNSVSNPGLVTPGSGNANKVWGTDVSGNPGWVATSGTPIPATIVATNFVLNQVYTNNSGSVQLLDASVALITTGVSGTAALDLYSDQSGGSNFTLQDRCAVSTLLTSLSMNYTNSLFGALSNNATYYFTNSSAGAGDSAVIVPGTGEIITVANGNAVGVAMLGSPNIFTAIQTIPTIQGPTTIYGSSGQTNWTTTDANGWHNTNNAAANFGVDISKGLVTAQQGFSGVGTLLTGLIASNMVGIVQRTIYTNASTNTWVVPNGCTSVHIIMVAGGGGGGSGGTTNSGTAIFGGGGGAGGGYENIWFSSGLANTGNILTNGTSIGVTNQAGGAGGAGQTVAGKSGNTGGVGGYASFGTFSIALGGNGGTFGGTSGGGGGQGNNSGSLNGGAGSASSISAQPNQGGSSFTSGAGGGGGGGLSATPTAFPGGVGGQQRDPYLSIIQTGGATNISTTASSGVGHYSALLPVAADAGCGSGATQTVNSGNGGAGGFPGGGGGGSGAAIGGFSTGTGGKGGDAYIMIEAYISQ